MSSLIKDVFPLGFPWRTQDPFLFCVHHLDHYPEGQDNLGPDPALLKGRKMGSDFSGREGFSMYHGQEVPGFPQHPHRGFETISVVRQGLMDHADSMGASARFGRGDTQWMTAGRGVVHSEMFPLLKDDDKNPLELFQIWLNLPQKDKMVDPYFTMLWREDTPQLTLKNDVGATTKITIIAGEYDAQKALPPPPNSWAAREHAQVHLYFVEMEDGATLSLPGTDKDVNRSVYFYEGDALNIGGTDLNSGHGIELFAEREAVLKATGSVKLLVLGGRPIGEPVAQYGPFVMNTRAEIQQAFSDYQRTQFGGWSWSAQGPVHGKVARRFAKHSDGREENKIET